MGEVGLGMDERAVAGGAFGSICTMDSPWTDSLRVSWGWPACFLDYFSPTVTNKKPLNFLVLDFDKRLSDASLSSSVFTWASIL